MALYIPIQTKMSGRCTIWIVEFCNNQMLPGFAIVVRVEPHDGVASNTERYHLVTHWFGARVDLNLLLHRDRSGVVIQAEYGDARSKKSLKTVNPG